MSSQCVHYREVHYRCSTGIATWAYVTDDVDAVTCGECRSIMAHDVAVRIAGMNYEHCTVCKGVGVFDGEAGGGRESMRYCTACSGTGVVPITSLEWEEEELPSPSG